MDWTMRLKAI